MTYIAGGTSSAQNGVAIGASVTTIGGVAIPPVTGTTTLTVSGQSLLVRLGTDNLVAGTAPINTKTYVAIVTDAAGNPTVGAMVQFALRPSRYRKGFFALGTITGVTYWTQTTITTAVVPATVPATFTITGGSISATCPNLDLNFNGILDPGEGLVTFPAGVTTALLPGAVASVNASAVTDASGIATATISYPKDQSYWSEVTLEARTSVTTNDPPTQVTFFLPGKAIDYDGTSVTPPGTTSPYGTGATCTDTL